MTAGYEPNELLGRLGGFRLYAVQFVLDYVQLYFDGPTPHCIRYSPRSMDPRSPR